MIKGRKVKLKILDDATKMVIGGQRGASLNINGETLDGTTKDSGDWQENEYGHKNWDVSCDGLYVASNAAHKVLIQKFLNSEKVSVVLEGDEDSNFDLTFTGLAVITSYPIEAPYDDNITFSVDLTGSGKLEIADEVGTPVENVTFSSPRNIEKIKMDKVK